jgi:hypothetical protein
MHRLSASLLALTASLAPPAMAENQIWTIYELKKEASAGLPVDLTLNGEIRFEPDGEVEQFVLRPGVAYAINKQLKVSGGYRYGQTLHDGPDQIEHRLWQQASYALAEIGDARIAGRTRLEQRFREGESGTGWRIRQQLSLEHPLGESGIRLALSNEIFLGLEETDWGNADGLQENRARATLRWTAGGIGWEAGYLNQFRNGVSGADDESNDHIFLGVSKSF